MINLFNELFYIDISACVSISITTKLSKSTGTGDSVNRYSYLARHLYNLT